MYCTSAIEYRDRYLTPQSLKKNKIVCSVPHMLALVYSRNSAFSLMVQRYPDGSEFHSACKSVYGSGLCYGLALRPGGALCLTRMGTGSLYCSSHSLIPFISSPSACKSGLFSEILMLIMRFACDRPHQMVTCHMYIQIHVQFTESLQLWKCFVEKTCHLKARSK